MNYRLFVIKIRSNISVQVGCVITKTVIRMIFVKFVYICPLFYIPFIIMFMKSDYFEYLSLLLKI